MSLARGWRSKFRRQCDLLWSIHKHLMLQCNITCVKGHKRDRDRREAPTGRDETRLAVLPRRFPAKYEAKNTPLGPLAGLAQDEESECARGTA